MTLGVNPWDIYHNGAWYNRNGSGGPLPIGDYESHGIEHASIGSLSSVTFNTNGTLNTFVRDGITWTCAYDSAGRLSTETASTGTVRTYGYSATTGLLESVTVA